jgi:tripartite ATP-independent transporter DctP family solute receptor
MLGFFVCGTSSFIAACVRQAAIWSNSHTRRGTLIMLKLPCLSASFTMRHLLPSALLAATAVSMLLSGGAASAQEIALRSADIHPPTYPTVQAVTYMGDLLKERSGGRISIEVFHSAQLGGEKETIEQTRFGVIDLNRINMAAINSQVPESTVFALPYVFRSVSHMRNVVDGPIGEQMLKTLEPQGMVGLAFLDSGARNLYNSKHPIKSMEDMKGLKIRVQQSDVFIDMITAMGGNATMMAYSELYGGIQTGVIDGAEQNWPSYQSTGHVDVAKYYTLSEHTMLPELLVMSKVKFDALSPEDQALIKQAGKDATIKMRELWEAREKEAEAEVRSKGAQVFSIDKKPLIEAMAPVYAKYLNTPELKKLFDDIQAVAD